MIPPDMGRKAQAVAAQGAAMLEARAGAVDAGAELLAQVVELVRPALGAMASPIPGCKVRGAEVRAGKRALWLGADGCWLSTHGLEVVTIDGAEVARGWGVRSVVEALERVLDSHLAGSGKRRAAESEVALTDGQGCYMQP